MFVTSRIGTVRYFNFKYWDIYLQLLWWRMDQFNQLYDPNWIYKDIKNAKVIAHKLEPDLRRATNHKLDVASEKRQKRKKMIKK